MFFQVTTYPREAWLILCQFIYRIQWVYEVGRLIGQFPNGNTYKRPDQLNPKIISWEF